jgi:hypothetical protein
MKPRHRAASITDTDVACWRFPRRKLNLSAHLFLQSRQADDRDAMLMLRCQQVRYQTFPVGMPPLRMFGRGGRILECGGAIYLPVNRERG